MGGSSNQTVILPLPFSCPLFPSCPVPRVATVSHAVCPLVVCVQWSCPPVDTVVKCGSAGSRSAAADTKKLLTTTTAAAAASNSRMLTSQYSISHVNLIICDVIT